MSRYRYQGGARRRMFVDGNGEAQSLSAAPVGPYITPPPVFTDWLAGRKIALLLIEGSARALDCISRYPGVRASQHDFLALRNGGFAIKIELARYHQLTPMGRRIATELLTSVANEFGLHHVSYPFWHCAKCTCGWSFHNQEHHGRQDQQRDAAVSRHLADPQVWIRARDASNAIIGNAIKDKDDDKRLG